MCINLFDHFVVFVMYLGLNMTTINFSLCRTEQLLLLWWKLEDKGGLVASGDPRITCLAREYV